MVWRYAKSRSVVVWSSSVEQLRNVESQAALSRELEELPGSTQRPEGMARTLVSQELVDSMNDEQTDQNSQILVSQFLTPRIIEA